MAKPIETRFCENCNEPVERGRGNCNNCGARLKMNKSRTGCVLAAVAIVIALFVVYSVSKYISSDRFETPQQTGEKAAADGN